MSELSMPTLAIPRGMPCHRSSNCQKSAFGPEAAGRKLWRFAGIISHERHSTWGARSRRCDGSQRLNISGASTTWSSTEMMGGMVTVAEPFACCVVVVIGACLGVGALPRRPDSDGRGVASRTHDLAADSSCQDTVLGDLDAVHQCVMDPDCLGVEPPPAGWEVCPGFDLPWTDAVGIEH